MKLCTPAPSPLSVGCTPTACVVVYTYIPVWLYILCGCEHLLHLLLFVVINTRPNVHRHPMYASPSYLVVHTCPLCGRPTVYGCVYVPAPLYGCAPPPMCGCAHQPPVWLCTPAPKCAFVHPAPCSVVYTNPLCGSVHAGCVHQSFVQLCTTARL